MDRGKCVSVMKGKFGKVRKYMIRHSDGKEVDCIPEYIISQINSGLWEVSNMKVHNNKLKLTESVDIIRVR